MSISIQNINKTKIINVTDDSAITKYMFGPSRIHTHKIQYKPSDFTMFPFQAVIRYVQTTVSVVIYGDNSVKSRHKGLTRVKQVILLQQLMILWNHSHLTNN